jgi:proteasome lid subunit RPN8/RPN11
MASPEKPRSGSEPGTADGNLSASSWENRVETVKKPFPGPRGVLVPLRVAFERKAYADVIAHAKESLDAEICGVLAGVFGEDDEGLYVHVQAAVRGNQAKEGSAHVTYTQETWNVIHQAMERNHPNLGIVGWYHSHPGFGVQFSDMDLFIQNNFFSGLAHIGLVTDPLGGQMALMATTNQGIEHLQRFWVDQREQRCEVPHPADSGGTVPVAHGGATQQTIEALETRVTQLVQEVDQLRNALYRFLVTMGMVVCLALVFGFAYYLIGMIFWPQPRPKNIAVAKLPIEIDGKQYLIGLGVVGLKVADKPLSIEQRMALGEVDPRLMQAVCFCSLYFDVSPHAGFPGCLPWHAMGVQARLKEMADQTQAKRREQPQ